MNLYAHDLSLFDHNFDFDSMTDPFARHRASISSASQFALEDDDYSHAQHAVNVKGNYCSSPPKHRHDGTSPLPFGMDWSSPPRKWDGRNTVWPHDPHSGWSYCVTIPSWTSLPRSRGSDPVAFFRVQVGVQSPEGITTTRTILRRFNDFIKLLSELKKQFPLKNLPPAPPKRLLRVKSKTLLEERRCSLEDWMEKLLSDIDLSRSAPVAIFLELEAAARSSFYDANQSSEISSMSGAVEASLFQAKSDISLFADSSSITSEHGYETPHESSQPGTPRQDNYGSNRLSGTPNRLSGDNDDTKPLRLDGTEFFSEPKDCKQGVKVRRLSRESVESDVDSAAASEISNLWVVNSFADGDLSGGSEAPKNADALTDSKLQTSKDLLVFFPSDDRHKMNRVLGTLKQRLDTGKTDVEDLIARLNQEVAVRQFLSTKVKDLEVELETTRQNCEENMEQTVLSERERFTQMQWDMEELRGKCLELELQLNSEKEEKMRVESTKISITHENKVLIEELDVVRKQLENLQKHHDDFEAKSKTEVKLLVKEVKSLRNSQAELKQELSGLIKEKLELERLIQKEKQRTEHAINANVKLLHECEILCSRLQECSVNFLVEEEDKLIVDTSSLSDARDLLTTSDNRIGLLLAEAQLLAEDIQNGVTGVEESQYINGGTRKDTDEELRKMLTDMLVDNAKLRKQVNSIIRCAVNTNAKAERDDDGDDDNEDLSLRETVLSKFLER